MSRTRCCARWPASRRCARTSTCRCSPAMTRCCATWAATTPPPSTSSTSPRLRAAAPEVNVTTDVIVGFPTEDEAAFERTLARARRCRHQPRARVLVLTAARAPPPRGSATASRRRRRSAARAALRGALRGPLAPAPRGKAGRRERVLIDKVADTQCSGYTRRLHPLLPAGAVRRARGELVDVVCDELHADGISCRASG